MTLEEESCLAQMNHDWDAGLYEELCNEYCHEGLNVARYQDKSIHVYICSHDIIVKTWREVPEAIKELASHCCVRANKHEELGC